MAAFFSSTTENLESSQGKSTVSSAREETEQNLFQDEAYTSAESVPKSKKHGCFLKSDQTFTRGYDGMINFAK